MSLFPDEQFPENVGTVSAGASACSTLTSWEHTVIACDTAPTVMTFLNASALSQ